MALIECPVVTIVSLVYNTGKYIIEPLNSIKKQSYKNIQHIIIDDGSKDDSVDIVENWIKQNSHSCTFIKHRENKGICASINEAIKIARGKYFSTIGDDIMMPFKVEKDVEFMEANPEYAFCYSNMVMRDMLTGKEQPSKATEPDNLFMDILEGNVKFTTPTHMYRMSTFEKVGLYDESLMFEDLDMVLRISHKYPVGYNNYFSVVYCRHGSNFHNTRGVSYFLEKDKILLKWKHLPNFWKYRNGMKQQTFEYYSDKNKKLALMFLLPSLTVFWKSRLYKSLIRLFFIWK